MMHIEVWRVMHIEIRCLIATACFPRYLEYIEGLLRDGQPLVGHARLLLQSVTFNNPPISTGGELFITLIVEQVHPRSAPSRFTRRASHHASGAIRIEHADNIRERKKRADDLTEERRKNGGVALHYSVLHAACLTCGGPGTGRTRLSSTTSAA